MSIETERDVYLLSGRVRKLERDLDQLERFVAAKLDEIDARLRAIAPAPRGDDEHRVGDVWEDQHGGVWTIANVGETSIEAHRADGVVKLCGHDAAFTVTGRRIRRAGEG